MQVRQWLGQTDIYLIDLILKGRFEEPRPLLDAGCGGGRNLDYFLQAGWDVYGVDKSHSAIRTVQQRAHRMAPSLPDANFRVERIEQLSFANARFSAVLSSAVLHFADSPAQFASMLEQMWRVLAPSGIFFARLASRTGLSPAPSRVSDGVFDLPDGSRRFLVDDAMLGDWTSRLGGSLYEPLRTVVVSGQRAMSTWVLKKGDVE